MRHIQHPGTVAAQRVDVVAATCTPLDLVLPSGASLLATLAAALAAQGARSAVLRLAGGVLFPFAHVMPATSQTPEHAVYFSGRFDAAAPVHLQQATVTFGERDGAPWLHCHAVWVDAAGARHCGHLLPDEVTLAAPVQATAWLLQGAVFQVQPDAETHFSLFRPVATGPASASGAGRPAWVLRLAPNEDVCTALEAVCRARGITQARVCGGVGSTVGAVFDDGRVVQPHITESLVRQGRVHTNAQGQLQAEIDVSMVDHLGGLSEGRLQRGQNPVLVTFELVLLPA